MNSSHMRLLMASPSEMDFEKEQLASFTANRQDAAAIFQERRCHLRVKRFDDTICSQILNADCQN